MLAEAHSSGRPFDPHFMPQTLSCGLTRIGYHHIVALEAPAEGLRRLAAAINAPFAPFPHRHRTVLRKRHPLPRAIRPLLEAIYRQDLHLLGYENATMGNQTIPWDAARAGELQSMFKTWRC